jgi:Ulp1 family protease
LLVISGELRYFLVNARNHWVADVWKIEWSRPTLTLYDSASNAKLQKEMIVHQLQTYLANMVPATFGERPKEMRHSADCGIYMTPNFVRANLRKGSLPANRTLPSTARPLFTEAVK